MRIGFCIDICLRKDLSGIGRYATGLLAALLESDLDSELVLYQSWSSGGTSAWPPEMQKIAMDCRVRIKRVPFPSSWTEDRPRVWWDLILSLLLLVDRVDVFHGFGHRVPSPPTLLRRWANVVTIHDLAFAFMEVHGDRFDDYLLRETKRALEASEFAICVSKATAEDCQNLGLCEPEKLKTVYQSYDANDDLSKKSTETANPFGIVRPFALCVGGLHPRKNTVHMFRAFAAVAESVDLDLVVAGADGQDRAEFSGLVESSNLSRRVHLLGFVSETEKAWLLSKASMLLYVSRYEGFGIVILEAMHYGLPVITSTAGGTVEAAGDAALLVDPADQNGLSAAILSLAGDTTLRERMQVLGRRQASRFSWSSTAVETLEIYQLAMRKFFDRGIRG